ncbi:MAG: ferritin-like domain-containing protein [Thermomicrobiales bacterium]|nr:ferritin-like domain-containing protein [Thermomicrobiales bacterium]
MTEQTGRRAPIAERLSRTINRRRLMASGGIAGAGALLGRAELLRTAAQDAPNLFETMNAAIALEAFAVTFYGAARGRGSALELDDGVTRFVRAAQCEEEAHYHFFEAAGAVPSHTTFTIAERPLSTQARFLNALVEVERLLVGAHMAIARQFAAAGDLRLVEIAYQIGAVEAQHQAMARLLAGERLGADRAFAGWMFREPADAIAALADLGYIGGDGDRFTYPGPVDRYCRGVSGLVAETTEDQPEDVVAPAASPVGARG